MPKGRKIKQLQQGEAKLWLLLIGVGEYYDDRLNPLPYAVADCQGVADALKETTKLFPQTEIIIYHSQSNNAPRLSAIVSELRRIGEMASPQDTILFYFSGHGILEPSTQQVYLCLADTIVAPEKLITTGLKVTDVLAQIAIAKVRQQIVILDACHSGGFSKCDRFYTYPINEEPKPINNSFNLSSKLVNIFQKRSAYSKGFYGLLSCDADQRSWEFPELGHGLFSYYLIKGLQGFAADSEGVIEAHGLYKYVFHNTLRYIDKLNQQRHAIAKQKIRRGEENLEGENPSQTPKLIVEAVGELVLGLRKRATQNIASRQALVVEGNNRSNNVLDIARLLGTAGGFELQYWHPERRDLPEVKLAIQDCLRSRLVTIISNQSL